VVFEGYFLAIGSTSLRYAQRICITAGLLAFAEYLALVYFAASHWDLNSPSYAPYPTVVPAGRTDFAIDHDVDGFGLSLALVRAAKAVAIGHWRSPDGSVQQGHVDEPAWR